MPLPRSEKPRAGYKDAKGRIWRKGPSRRKGEPFEWDVQLPDGSYLNIGLNGRETH